MGDFQYVPVEDGYFQEYEFHSHVRTSVLVHIKAAQLVPGSKISHLESWIVIDVNANAS